jgi:hypothetical protein
LIYKSLAGDDAQIESAEELRASKVDWAHTLIKKSNQSGVATTGGVRALGASTTTPRTKIASPTPLRRAAATDARDAPFSLVSSLQWARLSQRLERRVAFTCLSNRSFRLVSFV